MARNFGLPTPLPENDLFTPDRPVAEVEPHRAPARGFVLSEDLAHRVRVHCAQWDEAPADFIAGAIELALDEHDRIQGGRLLSPDEIAPPAGEGVS